MEDKIVHDFETKKPNNFSPLPLIIIAAAIVVGVGAGYFFSRGKTISSATTAAPQSASDVKKGSVYGSNDLKTFKDNATGVMQKGGVDGEGQYHLVRPGGDSQNVYLTSSIIDLSLFIGKKVEVFGETNAAKKAGWLMDVGRVEVLE